MDKASKHVPSSATDSTARFWRNLDELNETDAARAAAENEFSPETLDDRLPTTITRRGFLGLLTATAAVATAACTTHERTIVPYTKRPQEIIPGVANFYASTFSEGARSYSVLIKTREGRPIHVTGNDEDPRLRGKTSTRAVADVMGLYDADRLRTPRLDLRPATWAQAEEALRAVFTAAKRDGRPVLLLTGASNSPTRAALIAAVQRELPTLEHHSFEPGEGATMQAAGRAAFGVPVRTRLRLDRARVVVSLGADFLNGDDPEAIAAFTSQRRPTDPVPDMSRLWVFEGLLSLTGSNADERFAVRPSRLAAVGFALAHALHTQHGLAVPPGVTLPEIPTGFHESVGLSSEAWSRLVSDLISAKANAVVACGETMPTEAHLAAHLLNTMLGSAAIEIRETAPIASLSELGAVLQGMDTGKYSAVILWGTNPTYSFPDQARWNAAFAKVPTRIWIGLNPDESAEVCQWNLPCNHWLESWGDFGDAELLTLQQPAIAPLYDTRQGEEILLIGLRALGAAVPSDYRTYLRDRWQREVYPPDSPVPAERFFSAALHDGVLRRQATPPATPSLRAEVFAEPAGRAFAPATLTDFELSIHPSTQLYDGRYANNGWLQELPDPVTKITWNNPLTISVTDAKRLGVQNGDLVEVSAGDRNLTRPVVVQPGQANGVLGLALGYGRKSGSVARGIGENAFALMAVDSTAPNLRTSVKLRKLGQTVRLALTQRHHRMEGRDLVRSFTLPQFAHEAEHPRKHHHLPTLYQAQDFPNHKWGMVVDLAACTGCSACVIACQSENNIATVGAEQVERGREMHWLRIDSYYEGPAENPKVVHQPMLCQHCDTAPCENVCPVNATNHSPEGLNQMVYNRCVGTRYCANNCPYKVRRYNFFDYTSETKEPASLAYNPEVTVRPRGVMEKCTFCVQRIEDGKMRAKIEKRPLRDGDVVTACAAACPSGAIVFGDLKDRESRVARLSETKRGYKVLEELGTRPAVTYLANLTNPASEPASHGGSHE